MTPRSLFNIILKVLGVFFFRDILVYLSQLLGFATQLGKPEDIPELLWTVLTMALVLVVEAFFSYLLIFKTEWFIKVLKLERGFDQETIPINMHRSTILSISIIVIGGYLVANEIPNFCRQLFVYIQEKRMTHGQTNPKIDYTLVSGFKILVGSLLIAEQRLFVNLIERQRRK
jgi:hypothetical protein